MIRVLIVEDEPPTARALSTLIERHPAFEVIGIEYDGSDGLKTIETTPIDVVFTDIRMPIMDGVELLQNLYEDYPDIVSVVLSGYQEFEYAKAAIGYKAFDYLLKPFSYDDILPVLTRLEDVILERRKSSRREQIIHSMSGRPVPEAPEAPNCLVAVINIGAIISANTDWLSPGQVFWNEQDLEQLYQRIVGSSVSFLVFSGATQSQKVIVAENTEKEAFHDSLQQLLKVLSAKEVPVSIIGHSGFLEIQQVGEMINLLNQTLYRHALLYESCLFWWDMTEDKPTPEGRLETALAEEILEAIYLQEKDELEQHLTDMLEKVRVEELSQQELIRFLNVIVHDNRLAGQRNGEGFSSKLEIEGALANTMSSEDLGEDLASFLYLLGSPQEDEEKRSLEAVVEDMSKYLSQNYNKNISIGMLSQKYGFVPSYIRKIFRQYKNISPTEYLINCRMEKAKELLTNNTDLLVREVATMVGYKDPYYFSKVFKRETGDWPTDFVEHSQESQS